jgi:hypothetical protein
MTEILYIDKVSADSLEVGDQAIIDGDLCIIRKIDKDRDDIDEIYVWVENLDNGDDEYSLYADDFYDIWSI